MRGRIATTMLAVGTIVFALSVGHADAKSDKESCSATSTDVINTNPDGTGAECEASTGPPNQTTAHASDEGNALSEASDGGNSASSASGDGAGSEAQSEDGAEATATASGEGATTEAVSVGGSRIATLSLKATVVARAPLPAP